ncbi:MAG TPA: hypothetical protein ENN55_02910 [Firmicutes bacterium]|nr:hypothetical protein [Bacillota bacterium]
MKKILLGFQILILSAVPLFSETEMMINEFYGGSINMNFSVNSDALYGSRGDALRNGGTVSTLDRRQSISSYNPAGLAFLRGGFAVISGNPVRIGLDSDMVETFAGESLTDIVNEALEDAFSDFIFAPGVSPEVQSINAFIGQGSGIMGLEAVVPFAGNRMAVGIAREEKLSIDFNLLMNGMETLINVYDTDDPTLDAAARIKGSVSALLDVKNIVTTAAFGARITDNIGVGIAVERYESTLKLNAYADPDGSIDFMGNTYEFNTSASNSLYQEAVGGYSADGWGFKLGAAFQTEDRVFEAGFDAVIGPKLSYAGGIDVNYHTFPETLNPGDITLTEAGSYDELNRQININIPSYIRISLSWNPGVIMALNYVRYLEPFSFDFEDGLMELEMTDSIRLGLNFDVFQLGFGVIFSSEKFDFTDPDTLITENLTENIPIPLLSMGFVVPWTKQFETEFVLLALPMPFAKAAVSYNF